MWTRQLLCCLILLPFMFHCGVNNTTTTPSDSRPNIILIMADDMGYSDIGCYGGEIETPNIDNLAANGIRFTQFYNTSRCCPTRATLLTGLYSHQAGIGRMVSDNHLPGYRGFLTEDCVTIAEALKAGGYTTLMSGKWHVGNERPHWPVDRGFDRYFGLIFGAGSFWEQKRMALDNDYIPTPDNFYMTDAFTDYAVQFLDESVQKDTPFFLYLPFTAPHWPLHAWPEDIAKYRGKYTKGWEVLRQERYARMIEMGIIDDAWPLSPPDKNADTDWDTFAEQDDYDLRMAVYAAQIDRMDQGIGRVLAQVRAMGEEDNTLVFFLADNGGCHEIIDRGTPGVPAGPAESYLSYGREWANASNTPFRMYKHWVHEGGISTPLVVHWPKGILKPGSMTKQVGHLIDIMATCLDVAGVEYPKTYNGNAIIPLEGKSLAPILAGGIREPHEAIYWEHMGNQAIRQDKWKLVFDRTGPEKWELYDLEADRSEMNDLSDTHPDKARELAAMWDAWAERSKVIPYDRFQEIINSQKKK
jgi:arylsulfatase A-like enzyme